MTNENVRPVGHMCLIRLVEVATKIGSIYVPDSTKDQRQGGKIHGRLLKAGPTAFTEDRFGDHPPEVGDVVVIKRYGGQSALADAWEDQNAEVQLISADDILGVVEGDHV